MVAHPSLRYALVILFLLLVAAASTTLGKSVLSATLGGRPDQQVTSSLRPYISNGTSLRPLDPNTLSDVAGAPAIRLGGRPSNPPDLNIVTNPNGSLLAIVSRKPSASWPPRPRDITIRILDARTGPQSASFHPSVLLVEVDGISPDGSEIFGYSGDENMGAMSEWDAVSATNGHLLHRLRFAESCCDPALYDPVRLRLYTVDTGYFNSQGVQDTAPRTPVLVAYNVRTGRRVGRLPLPGVWAGSWFTSRQAGGHPVIDTWVPGFALSPDGSRLAVLDAQRNVLLLIDSHSLKVVKTEALRRPQSLLDRVGAWLGLVPEVASAKEFEGIELEMYFSLDGSRLYVTGTRGHIDKGGRFTGQGLGIRAIDVRRGEIVGEALAGQVIWWSGPSPDGRVLVMPADLAHVVSGPSPNGRAIYTLGPLMRGNAQLASSFILRRHDPVTLQTLAERRFVHRPNLVPWLWFLAAQ